MKIVNHLEESVWRSYIKNHSQSNIFHSPEIFQVFLNTKGYDPELWATVDKNNCPLALFMPVKVTVAGQLLKRLTSRSISYGSVLCDQGSQGEEALAALLEKYKQTTKNRVLFTELRNQSDITHLQPILKNTGFSYERHINYLVDLECSKRTIMQRFGKRTRKHIRRAIRNDRIVVEEVTQKEQIKICYKLLKKTYDRAQVFLSDISLFQNAFKILYPKQMVRFLLVRIDDEYIATSVELLFKDTIYGWYGGLDRTFSSYSPNELLTWHIFEWGIDNGYKIYDFGGAGNPDEHYGVRDFKAKFKGRLVNYGRNIYIHSPNLLKLSKFGYRFFQCLLALKTGDIFKISRRIS